MDTIKIRTNTTTSKMSNEVNNSLDVNLEHTSKLTNLSNYSDVIDAYQVFENERAKSNKFRLIFTINPYCSNVLFNTITEIVKNEGSDKVEIIRGDDIANCVKAEITPDVVTNTDDNTLSLVIRLNDSTTMEARNSKNGSLVNNVTWSVDNENICSILTVDGCGKVSPYITGTAIVTAEAEGYQSAKATVKVVGPMGKQEPERKHMIMNTEYSDSTFGYEYHPGYDIFTNHIFRNKTFKLVNPMYENKKGCKEGLTVFTDEEYSETRKEDTYDSSVYEKRRYIYNTIGDNLRYDDGTIVEYIKRTKLPENTTDYKTKRNKHLYDHLDILSYEDSIAENLTEDYGWVGFVNNSTIGAKEYSIEEGEQQSKDTNAAKILNNHEACEFIDMYPDRSLFSFNPKYNEYRKRLEYNWDVCITYPYKNYEDHDLVQGGMKVLSVDFAMAENGKYVIMFRTYAKHGLNRNDIFTLHINMDEFYEDVITYMKGVDLGGLSTELIDELREIVKKKLRKAASYVEDLKTSDIEVLRNVIKRNLENAGDTPDDDVEILRQIVTTNIWSNKYLGLNKLEILRGIVIKNLNNNSNPQNIDILREIIRAKLDYNNIDDSEEINVDDLTYDEMVDLINSNKVKELTRSDMSNLISNRVFELPYEDLVTIVVEDIIILSYNDMVGDLLDTAMIVLNYREPTPDLIDLVHTDIVELFESDMIDMTDVAMIELLTENHIENDIHYTVFEKLHHVAMLKLIEIIEDEKLDDTSELDKIKDVIEKKIKDIDLPYTVKNIGNAANENEDYYFYTTNMELTEILLKDSNFEKKYDNKFESIRNAFISAQSPIEDKVRYRRTVNGVESDYYFRIFRKLPNLKKAHLNLDDEIARNDDTLTKYIKANATKDGHIRLFDKEIYRLAFARTIYNDMSTQVTYTDTIDINHFVDNRGRPLTQLYFTIVKRNKGADEWYKINGEINNEKVEYSHCFGKITSGIEMSCEPTDVLRVKQKKAELGDVRFLNNLSLFDSKPLEDNITFDGTYIEEDVINENKDISREYKEKVDCFLGDLVEYNANEVKEHRLAWVNHRFNTMQRELNNDNYKDFQYQEIEMDDYDFIKDSRLSSGDNFTIRNYSGDGWKTEEGKDLEIWQRPEGYFYQPHYEINVREFGPIQQSSHYNINVKDYSIENIGENNTRLFVTTSNRANVAANDVIIITLENDEIVYGYVSEVFSTYTFSVAFDNNDFLRKITNNNIKEIRRKNEDIPEYADNVTGTSAFLWRDTLRSGDNGTVDLPEYTFTNGSFYIHTGINFFLRRQDPNNEIGLQCSTAFPNDINGNIKERSIYEYKDETFILC